MAALSRKNRLTDKKTIGLVMRRGRRIVGKGLRAHVGRVQAADSWRASVIVSKKVDKRATVRNKLRRQTSEIIRQAMRSSVKPSDVIIYLEPGSAELSFGELKETLKALLEKAVN